MDKRKWLARLLIVLFFSAIALPIPASIIARKRDSQSPRATYRWHSSLSIFENGDVYVNEDYIWDSNTGHRFSLFPYAFYDSEIEYPEFGEESFNYRAGYMWYSFTADEIASLENATLANPQISFPCDKKGNRSRIYNKDGVLYTEDDTDAWFFRHKKKVCVLQAEECFFDPIRVEGVEGSAILIISQKNPNKKSVICVYVYTDGKWSQAQFQLINQKQVSELEGFVRRHVDINVENIYSQDTSNLYPGVGNIEIGIENDEGNIALHSVTYKNGVLLLEADDSHSTILPEEWIY